MPATNQNKIKRKPLTEKAKEAYIIHPQGKQGVKKKAPANAIR